MPQHLGCSCSKLGLFKLSRAKEQVGQKSGVLLWGVERTRTRHRQLQHEALPEIQLIHQNVAKLSSVASDASRTFRRPGRLFISAEEEQPDECFQHAGIFGYWAAVASAI